jgi:anti-sigma B factor antagonist
VPEVPHHAIAMFLIKDPTTSDFHDQFYGPEIVEIGLTCSEARAVITVTGELDLSNTTWLYECLHDAIDAGVIDVVLDFAELTYMDSTGLSILKGAYQRILVAGGTIAVRAALPIVKKLFAVTGGVPFMTMPVAPEGVHAC